MTAAGNGAWLQLTVLLPAADCAATELLFEELGALAITLRDAADQPILEPDPGTTPLWQLVQLQALFSADTDLDATRDHLRRELGAGVAIGAEWLAEQTWERAWMAHFKPMQFGRRLWICPTGYAVPDAAEIVVHLDPGLAFGTGTHPTTALCLQWLDRAKLQDLQVLDYGCGSGVLAIAALALGARSAVAIDIDEQAVEATLANAARNGLQARLVAGLPATLAPAIYDLVIANILAGPLVDLAPVLSAATRAGSWLVLSGLLETQVESVRAAYRDQFALDECRLEDGWACLAGQRLP